MDSGTRRAKATVWPAVLVLVSAMAAAAVYADSPPAPGAGVAAPAQDVIRIESRLTQLEQRLHMMETSLRGVEQQLRLSATGRGAGDPEVRLLRSEVESLRRRLAEVECGLARVDERTLGAAARDERRKSGAGAGEPCRLNADAPLNLPARP